LGERPVQRGLDGADRDAERVGDVGDVELLVVTQGHDRSSAPWQLQHRRREFVGLVWMIEVRLGPRNARSGATHDGTVAVP